jgi:hypothetical protein
LTADEMPAQQLWGIRKHGRGGAAYCGGVDSAPMLISSLL